jgi:hypothetical protein
MHPDAAAAAAAVVVMVVRVPWTNISFAFSSCLKYVPTIVLDSLFELHHHEDSSNFVNDGPPRI